MFFLKCHSETHSLWILYGSTIRNRAVVLVLHVVSFQTLAVAYPLQRGLFRNHSRHLQGQRHIPELREAAVWPSLSRWFSTQYANSDIKLGRTTIRRKGIYIYSSTLLLKCQQAVDKDAKCKENPVFKIMQQTENYVHTMYLT